MATAVVITCGGSTPDLDLLRRVFDRECGFFRGRPVTCPDGRLMAAFDGPGRAVQCAASVISIARQSRIAARAGVHIGEFDASCSELPLLATTAVIADAAANHEIIATRNVTDLLAGAGFTFQDRGRVDVGDDRPLAVFSVTAV